MSTGQLINPLLGMGEFPLSLQPATEERRQIGIIPTFHQYMLPHRVWWQSFFILLKS